MITIKRSEAIEDLLDSELGAYDSESEYVADLLTNGCKGFNNYTNRELAKALLDLTREEYKVVYK